MGPSNKTVVSIKFLASNETESENATKHVSEEIQSCLPWTVVVCQLAYETFP